MKTLDEVQSIVEDLNEEAHNQAWDTWIHADELTESDDEADWETAEEVREQASDEQSAYFRESFWNLDDETTSSIIHWCKQDEDFKEQFSMYYGEAAFEEEVDLEQE